jgi:hypothetical protein
VRHYAIRRSTDGLWYRISEWVDRQPRRAARSFSPDG